MGKFTKEFKEFALKGNMIDLAVGIIVGGAFTAIVGSLVDDVINPILGIFTGKIDFASLFVTLDGSEYASLADAEEAGAAVLKYGAFISAVINFIIMALVVFIIVLIINRLRNAAAKSEEAAPETKTCPHCQSEIHTLAKRCPQCTSILKDL